MPSSRFETIDSGVFAYTPCLFHRWETHRYFSVLETEDFCF